MTMMMKNRNWFGSDPLVALCGVVALSNLALGTALESSKWCQIEGSPDSGGGAPSSGSGAPSSTAGVGSGSSDGGTSSAPASPSATPATPAASPSPGSAPSQTAAQPSLPTPPQSLGADPFNFDTIFQLDEAPPVEVPVVATPPQVQQQPIVPPAPQAPAPQSQQPAVPQSSQTTPSSGGLDPAEPGTLARALRENEQMAIDHLAQTTFALTPQEIQALETDAANAIPKLLAKSFVMAQQNFLLHLSKSVPLMMQRFQQTSTRNRGNEDAFYSKFPAIKRDAHGEIVSRIARGYRAANPTATKDQMYADVGAIVMAMAKINPQQTPQPAFVPGAAGGPAAAPQSGGSPWDILGQHE